MTDPVASQRPSAFIPAKPSRWLIAAAQTMVRAELALSNRLYVSSDDLDIFRRVEPGTGLILASNHADETDPLVCLELSRRLRKQFITMCNREAFDEFFGFAGYALQRLGHFSVKRGAHDGEAKDYAIETVRQGQNVLVIFPEGEIYYLNDIVQHFHSGAIEIALQAIMENRQQKPNWSACIMPMAIKYHYGINIEPELERRIARMESHLMLRSKSTDTLQSRLLIIRSVLLDREKRQHSLRMEQASDQNITQQLDDVQKDILNEVLHKHSDLPVSSRAPLIDQTWQMEAELRQKIKEQADHVTRAELKSDLESLKEVAQLTSWRPSYWKTNASTDRLAEAILKTERELYRIKRPKQLANRHVFVRFAEPIDMGIHLSGYLKDSHIVRASVTESLHAKIQGLIDTMTLGDNPV